MENVRISSYAAPVRQSQVFRTRTRSRPRAGLRKRAQRASIDAVTHMSKLALAIRWPDFPGSITRLKRLYGVPVYHNPRQSLVGSRVAIVQQGDVVSLIFDFRDVVERSSLRLADGTVRAGYVVRA